VALIVPIFLCPADTGHPARPDRGPGNYVACSGSGADATIGNGIFYVNSKIRITDILDGSSNTVAISESLLGPGTGTNFLITDPGQVNKKTMFVSLATADTLDESTCQQVASWRTDRGSTWADGAYPHGLFNTWYPPNAEQIDCIRHSNPGWRAARSNHTGGVNVLFADGSIHFINDNINLTIWQALGTRAGGELISGW
jgi:prepilin-type processing-associated H-X9-DG protein